MRLILMNLIVSKTVVNETHEVDNPFCGFFSSFFGGSNFMFVEVSIPGDV